MRPQLLLATSRGSGSNAFAAATTQQQQQGGSAEAQQHVLSWLDGNGASGGATRQLSNGLIEATKQEQHPGAVSENPSFLLSFAQPQPVISGSLKRGGGSGDFAAAAAAAELLRPASSSGRLQTSSHMLPPRGGMRMPPTSSSGGLQMMANAIGGSPTAQQQQQQRAWHMRSGAAELGRVEEDSVQNRHQGGLDANALLDQLADLHGSDLLMRDWPGGSSAAQLGTRIPSSLSLFSLPHRMSLACGSHDMSPCLALCMKIKSPS